jgi:hypothetical protein
MNRLRPALALALPALAVVAGCAPSLHRLVDGRHYDEALCALRYGPRAPDRDRDRLLRHLEDDVDVALHVHGLTRPELVDALGEPGGRIADELVLLRVLVDANPVSVDRFQVEVGLDAGPDGTRRLELDRKTLAGAAGERLPLPRTVVVDPGGTRLKRVDLWLLFAGIGEGLLLGTVPVTELTGHVERRPRRTATEAPSAGEYLKHAPVAETLFRALHVLSDQGSWRRDGPVRQASVWTRPAGPDVRLTVRWVAEAACGDRGHARLERTATVALPPGDTLEERLARLFSGRMRRLSGL